MKSCKLMQELERIEGVRSLPYKSIEKIKRIICGTHNGVCEDRYLDDIKSCSNCGCKRHYTCEHCIDFDNWMPIR